MEFLWIPRIWCIGSQMWKRGVLGGLLFLHLRYEHNSLCWQLHDHHRRRGVNDCLCLWASSWERPHNWLVICDLHIWSIDHGLILSTPECNRESKPPNLLLKAAEYQGWKGWRFHSHTSVVRHIPEEACRIEKWWEIRCTRSYILLPGSIKRTN